MSILLVSILLQAASDRYEFVKDDRIEVRKYISDGQQTSVYSGYINRYGEFVYLDRLTNNAQTKFENVKFWLTVLNQDYFPNEVVYEYRDGLLIPGRFGGNKQFIPSIEMRIITFSDYLAESNKNSVALDALHERPKDFPFFNGKKRSFDKLSADGKVQYAAIRIYNLPGYFKKIGPPATRP